MEIRCYKKDDAPRISEILRQNLTQVAIKKNPEFIINELIEYFDGERIEELSQYANIYVFCIGEEIAGCGVLAAVHDECGNYDIMRVSEQEQALPVHSKRRMALTGCACDIIMTEFVKPSLLGNNFDKKLTEKLFLDELYKNAQRTQLLLTVPAFRKYMKLAVTRKEEYIKTRLYA